MRPCLTLLLAAAAAAPLAAQRIEPEFYFGMRASVAGELVVPVPIPANVGFASTPRTFSERSGFVVGGSARIPLGDVWGVLTGVNVVVAERFSETGGITRRPTSSTVLTSGQLGLSVLKPLTERLGVVAALGGELIHLGGEVYAEGFDWIVGSNVEPTRRLVAGTNASVGARYSLRRAGAVRLNAQWRRYRIESRWSDPTYDDIYGSPESRPYSDLLVTVGWSPDRRE